MIHEEKEIVVQETSPAENPGLNQG